MMRRAYSFVALTALALTQFGCGKEEIRATQEIPVTTSIRLHPPHVLTISVDLSSGIFPGFDPSITDYVSRCIPGKPTTVTVKSQPGVSVAVGKNPPTTEDFSIDLMRSEGQSIRIIADAGDLGQRLYYIRCLPLDFQWWTTAKFGPTEAEWYQVMPRRFHAPPEKTPYPAIFDNNGIPVWWTPKSRNAIFAQLSQNEIFTWLKGDLFVTSVSLDGTIYRELHLPDIVDHHDIIELTNGNFLLVVMQNIDADLHSWGLTSKEPIINNVIIEYDPQGNVLWSWSAYEHIPLEDTPARYRQKNGLSYDPYHFNSLEGVEDSVIVSFRNLNAIYRIDRRTGDIEWKLGGAWHAKSLTIINDIVATSISGQHDARLLPDGTLTLHENGTSEQRTPRALRFHLDLEKRTATIIENLGGYVRHSNCCGSARRLSRGNWVIGFGDTNSVLEVLPSGETQFSIRFDEGIQIYRAVPIPYGQLDRQKLRDGMDTQYPVIE